MLNTILEGDAITELRKKPSNYIDCIITEPPYGNVFSGLSKIESGCLDKTELFYEWNRILKDNSWVIYFGLMP